MNVVLGRRVEAVENRPVDAMADILADSEAIVLRWL
jgi:hypothetical protein